MSDYPKELRQLAKEMTEGDPKTAAMLTAAAKNIEGLSASLADEKSSSKAVYERAHMLERELTKVLKQQADADVERDKVEESLRSYAEAAAAEVEYLCRELEVLGYHKGAAISRDRVARAKSSPEICVQPAPMPERLAMMIGCLRHGEQADPDGVMVKVSRQACEEAADLIERHAAECVHQVWRSVAEELPSEMSYVLAVERQNTTQPFVPTVAYYTTKGGRHMLATHWVDSVGDYIDVTHWTPLPPDPRHAIDSQASKEGHQP